MSSECNGTHHYFVVNDAASEGKVFVFLACTACGEGKKLEFEVADKTVMALASK